MPADPTGRSFSSSVRVFIQQSAFVHVFLPENRLFIEEAKRRITFFMVEKGLFLVIK